MKRLVIALGVLLAVCSERSPDDAPFASSRGNLLPVRTEGRVARDRVASWLRDERTLTIGTGRGSGIDGLDCIEVRPDGAVDRARLRPPAIAHAQVSAEAVADLRRALVASGALGLPDRTWDPNIDDGSQGMLVVRSGDEAAVFYFSNASPAPIRSFWAALDAWTERHLPAAATAWSPVERTAVYREGQRYWDAYYAMLGIRPPPVAPSQSPPAAPPAPAPPASRSPCDAVQVRFAEVLGRATGACAADSGCGCYDPVAPGTACGGVTDRPTSERLAAIEAEFHALGCDWPVQCGPWACEPRCVEGRCR